MRNVIIAGGGLAGVRAAEALRAQGYGGELTLLSAEDRPPYDRPPLSKAVLTGATDDTTVETDWSALNCALRLGVRATGLRLAAGAAGAAGGTAAGTVETTAGEFPFDGLVIATGATPIRLPGPGPQHVVRTLDDALRLRDRLVAGRRIVIVGAGWIGAEVATTAAAKGCEVTVVEAADTPLAGVLGAEIGARTMPWYAAAGVTLRTGVKVAAVETDGLALADGTRIAADEVVVGVGVRPEIGWLAGSGIETGRGVLTDASLSTGHPGVVAVGDCAEWWSRRYGRRLLVEHWDTALNAPETAAATLLGTPAEYDAVPYFWSEQFGRMVQYAGHHTATDRLVLRGDPQQPKWAACWLAGDRLQAVLTVDRPRDLVQARRIIAAGGSVDVAAIADAAVAVRNAVKE